MLKFSFLAISLILIAQTKAAINPECAKSSYWCQSIQNANKCNAFKHCLQTVWSTHSKYLEKNLLKLNNNPNSCQNCVQCVGTDITSCPYVHFFKEEISQLKSYNIPAETICKLLRQCNEKESSEEINNSIENKNDYKFDSRFKCGLHPRNWCDNLETAKRCDAFENCIKIWSSVDIKYKPKEVDTNLPSEEVKSQQTCGFCMFIFNKLQQVIQQNQTEVNIKDYLESACSLLPDQEFSKKCVQQVDTYLPEIYNLLRNNIDAGIICRVLKQCEDKNLEIVSSSPKLEEKQNKKDILKDIKIKILNEDKAVIKTPLKKLNLLGSKSETLVVELKKSMGVGCELCTIVMNAAKYLVINKHEDEKVLNFIEKQLCSRMGNLNSTCVEYVEQEGAEIIQLLIHSVDPAIVCHAMGLCLKVQISDEYIKEKFYDLNVRNALNCTLCKIVFEQVKKMLTEEQSQAKILNYIDLNLCHKVGKSKEMCKSLIDAYGPLFLEIIARDVKPAQLCTMIGMCVENQEDQYIDYEIKESFEYVSSGPNCVICEFVMTVLKKYINNNSSAEEIDHWLHYVCDKAMPVQVRAECSSFVDAYGKLIISLLENQVTPEKVCSFIGLCTKKIDIVNKHTIFENEKNLYIQKSLESAEKQSASEKIQIARNTDIKCTVCQYAMQYINSEYHIDKTEKAIEFTIENVCKLTPKSYRHHCDNMVDSHGVGLISFMQKYSDPLIACASIRLCHVENNKVEENVVEMIDVVPAKKIDESNELSTEVGNNKTLQCSLCLYVAQVVDEKLAQNKTEEQIVDELKLVCNLFPNSLKEQCTAFIVEYGPYVVQLIAADLNPETTCAALKLCEKTIVKESLRQNILKDFYKN